LQWALLLSSQSIKLLHVFWHILPEHLYTTPNAFISLQLFELQYVVYFHVKPVVPFGFILALVANQFFCNYLPQPLLAHGFFLLGTLLWWTNDPFELLHIFRTQHCEVSVVGTLEIVVHNPDLLWVIDVLFPNREQVVHQGIQTPRKK